MRTGFTYALMPSSTAGVNGGRYTLQQLAQNATYASVFKRVGGLSDTYADGTRMHLPPAIEAAETMLSPKQTSQLCEDVFSHIGITAFQAFEKFPAIFRVARGHLRPKHVFKILEKLTQRCRNTLPFHALAPFIEAAEGLSPKQMTDLISTAIYPDGALTCRLLDRLAPALHAVRPRLSSNDETVRFFRLIKGRFGKKADKIIRSLPTLLDGVEGRYAPEQILDVFTKERIPGLSPAGNAIVTLYKIALFKRGALNPDLAVEALIEVLKSEGAKSCAHDLPTVGGKIGGARSDFNEGFFDYLDILGFECREEILFRSWDDVSRTRYAMIVLPAARSAFEASMLIDMLRDVGVFRDGAVLRHQITVASRLVEEAKYIALALHSGQPIPIPYPDMFMTPIKGFNHLAPVVDGGWELTDINRKRSFIRWRFDLPLIRVYALMDEKRVLRNALGRNDDDRSFLEQILVGVYEKIEESLPKPPKEQTREGVPDEALEFLMLHKKERNGFFVVGKMVRPDVTEQFFKALENVYGENLVSIRANHEFNIYATQLLAWAMKSPWRSQPRRVYKRFMDGMHDLYRQVGIESTLRTRWLKRSWDQIYPSLSRLDAIKDRSFHLSVRQLVVKTVQELQGMV